MSRIAIGTAPMESPSPITTTSNSAPMPQASHDEGIACRVP